MPRVVGLTALLCAAAILAWAALDERVLRLHATVSPAVVPFLIGTLGCLALFKAAERPPFLPVLAWVLATFALAGGGTWLWRAWEEHLIMTAYESGTSDPDSLAGYTSWVTAQTRRTYLRAFSGSFGAGGLVLLRLAWQALRARRTAPGTPRS